MGSKLDCGWGVRFGFSLRNLVLNRMLRVSWDWACKEIVKLGQKNLARSVSNHIAPIWAFREQQQGLLMIKPEWKLRLNILYVQAWKGNLSGMISGFFHFQLKKLFVFCLISLRGKPVLHCDFHCLWSLSITYSMCLISPTVGVQLLESNTT